MKVKILEEAGYAHAMLGLSLSHEQPVEKMSQVAMRLYKKGDGHNKFLESMVIWLDITAPRWWWQQYDTYRIMSKQSGSTMHTIMKRRIRQSDFRSPIFPATLWWLNFLRRFGKFFRLKNELPEGFLQRRIVKADYKTIRNIIRQRLTHRMPEWQIFCKHMFDHLEHFGFLQDLRK